MNRSSLANAIVVPLACLLAPWVRPAPAAIVVESKISAQAAVLDGIRVQAVVTDTTGRDDRGGTNPTTAVGIKEFTASILFRDDNITNGIAVQKTNLTAAQAYGLGLPFGNTVPPTTDPKGPWQGLVWPYRDQYDYFPAEFDPLGDDVGIPFSDQPGVYGFVDIHGIARGGPTDPDAGGGDPNRLLRGIDGNGVTAAASYFLFDIIPLLGPFDRDVRIKIFGASAIVVQQDNVNGAYSEIQVPVADFEALIRLPEPATTLAITAVAIPLALRARRGRTLRRGD